MIVITSSMVILHRILYETDGSDGTVDGFQGKMLEIGKDILRAIHPVLAVGQNNRTAVGYGINRIFQHTVLSGKSLIKAKYTERNEKQTENTEKSTCSRSHNRPENSKTDPEDHKDHKKRCILNGCFSGRFTCPEQGFILI